MTTMEFRTEEEKNTAQRLLDQVPINKAQYEVRKAIRLNPNIQVPGKLKVLRDLGINLDKEELKILMRFPPGTRGEIQELPMLVILNEKAARGLW